MVISRLLPIYLSQKALRLTCLSVYSFLEDISETLQGMYFILHTQITYNVGGVDD